MRFKPLVLIYGAGEIGSAIAHRLFRARFRVMINAKDDPLTLMRGNAFSQAIFKGAFEVEGVPARKAVVTEAVAMIDRELIPLLTAESRSVLEVLNPDIVVEARFPPPKGELSVGDTDLIVGIGDGLTAGKDCDLVVTTDPGHNMGRILYRGKPPTPSAPLEEGTDRTLITAARAGTFSSTKRMGQTVQAEEPFGTVGDEEVCSDRKGVICGMLQDGVEVPAGAVLAEVDAQGTEDNCYTISGLGRSISGSVLEVATAWVADMGGIPYPPQIP